MFNDPCLSKGWFEHKTAMHVDGGAGRGSAGGKCTCCWPHAQIMELFSRLWHPAADTAMCAHYMCLLIRIHYNSSDESFALHLLMGMCGSPGDSSSKRSTGGAIAPAAAGSTAGTGRQVHKGHTR
jgi:hypothetical protein